MATELNVIDGTLEIDLGVADGVITDLKARLTNLSADSHYGYQLVSAGIAEVAKWRTGLEKSRLTMKAPFTQAGKDIDSEAHRVKALLLEIETPLREEKARIDNAAEVKRKAKEEAERLALEAKERAEREALEAEERAKREEEQKQRDAEDARLKTEREALAEDRRKLEAERKKAEAERLVGEKVLRVEREAIEANRLKIEQEAWYVRQEKEAAKRESIDKVERERAAEAEKVRLAKEEDEAERLAEERKPDQQKLSEYADRLWEVERPIMSTEWGKERLASALYFCNETLDCLHDIVTEGES